MALPRTTEVTHLISLLCHLHIYLRLSNIRSAFDCIRSTNRGVKQQSSDGFNAANHTASVGLWHGANAQEPCPRKRSKIAGDTQF